MDALGLDVAGGDVLHRLGRATAFGVDQKLRVGVLRPGRGDVCRPDAGVHVALAVPHVEARVALGVIGQAELARDERTEPHVRPEEDLGLGPVLAQMCSTTRTALDDVQQ